MKTDFDKPILDRDGNPLKIGLIGAHHCIRIIKRATALKRLGYTLYGAGDKISYGTNLYKTYFVWQNHEQLKETVRILINEGVTIIDYSNEPDFPVPIIREVINDMNVQDRVKLIVDIHDLDSVRRGFIPKPEREMFNAADGLIYVSLPIQEMTNKLQSVSMPNIVLYSYCNDGVIEYEDEEIKNRKGLVYEGGANPPEDNELNRVFEYRDLYGIIKKLVEMGNETSMYCGNLSAFDSYQNIGAVVYPPTIYNEMMKELTKYKYGILIFNNADGKKDQVNFTLSNKEQEYLQAGLPSLACWCPESKKHVEKHGTGFVFEDIEEIKDCSHLEDKYLEIMDNIKVKRKELIMRNFIWRLENLYANILSLEKKSIPDDIKDINVFEYGDEDVGKLLE